jgi:hypothetical protein
MCQKKFLDSEGGAGKHCLFTPRQPTKIQISRTLIYAFVVFVLPYEGHFTDIVYKTSTFVAFQSMYLYFFVYEKLGCLL